MLATATASYGQKIDQVKTKGVWMAKCSECGFLAWRERKTRELHEVEHGCRDSCVFPYQNVQDKFEPQPLCFANACDIRDEIGKATNAKSVLTKDRNCGKFVEWNSGMSPKEHCALVFRRQDLEWQSAESEKNRAFQERQSEQAKRDEERRHRESIQSNRIAIAVSTLIAIASLAASIFMNYFKN